MEVLRTTELSKNYGKLRALDNLNLIIESGKVYGLLGPNGSGKTTTLGIIMGVLSDYLGSFKWFEGRYGADYRKRIGCILETPNFYPYLDAIKNLEIVALIKDESKPKIEELLQLVGLYDRRYSSFQTYSLGMKQRLAIAATLIGDPDVLIFDEPTNGLDPQGIAEVRDILYQIAQSGKTVLMASHILDEVEKICTDVAIIKNGKLLAQGPVGQILSPKLTLELRATNFTDQLRVFLNSHPDIEVVHESNSIFTCAVEPNFSTSELNQFAFRNNITLDHILLKKQRLEEEFLKITSQK